MEHNTQGFLCGLLFTFAAVFLIHTIYDAMTMGQVIESLKVKNCACEIKK